MTSLSRRKPRTTAPRTRIPRTAASLAALLLLAGGSAFGQQPPGRTPGGYSGLPPAFQPGGAAPARSPAPAAPARPFPPPAAGEKGIPPGYRAVTNPTAPPAPERSPGSISTGGQVMYFHKPADALAPTPGAGGVALASNQAPGLPALPTPGIPDAPAATPSLPPLPPAAAPVVPNRPIPTAAPAGLPPLTGQPKPDPPRADPTIVKKPPPPEVTQLPPRDKIFTVYNDDELEQIIIRITVEELKKKKEVKDVQGLMFPPLTSIRNELAPPGTVYQSKTPNYEPRQALYEPNYVVHRRLHFEEKNAERYGWDLGIIQPFVSTLYFYKDVMLWPNSLASGCVYGFWDTSAGKCLPGSPVPYYLYPPGLTITGTAFEAGLITGLAFIP